MTKNHINLAVDLDGRSLRKAAEGLMAMAEAYGSESRPAPEQKDDPADNDAARAFAEPPKSDTPAPTAEAGETVPTASETPETAASAATQAPAGSAAELDASGLPWDHRIHSSGKTQYKSGSNKGDWVYKRGVDQATITQVEDELRQVMGAGAPAEQEQQPPVTPPADSGGYVAPPHAEQAVVPPPEAEQAATVPVPQDFMTLVQHISSGTFTQEKVVATCAEMQLPGIQAFAQRPDLIPAFWAKLNG